MHIKRVAVIFNPLAGSMRGRIPPLKKLSMKTLGNLYVPKKSNREILDTVRNFFQKKNISVEIFESKKIGEATEFARGAAILSVDLIIAAGGDGTINEVINGMAGGKARLGVLPLGTANSFAAQMQIPFELTEALEICVSGKPQIIDLGRANGRYFSIAAGVGFDARAVKEVRPGIKRMFGSFAYILAVMKVFFTYRHKKLRIMIDDTVRTEGFFAIICNTRFYAGEFEITSDAVIDDGFLDIVIFKKQSAAALISYMMKISLGILGNYRGGDVEYRKAKKVSLESEENIDVHIDGEPFGFTPLHVDIVSGVLEVMSGKKDA